MMTLEDLGYNASLEKYRIEFGLADYQMARVIAEHKDRYEVSDGAHDYVAEMVGLLRFTATSREQFPAVGDWVAISVYDNDKAMIHAVLPRKNALSRLAVGKFAEKQLIAANIDTALIVVAADRDFNINRVERFASLCFSSSMDAVVVLNKIDLIDAETQQNLLGKLKDRLPHLPVVGISNATHSGYDQLKLLLEKGKTFCLLGSSGVGKSTMINHLSGQQWLKTGSISQSTHKGQHVTTHRELVVCDGGYILIDNPGMREVGIADVQEGLDRTFASITDLAQQCKFQDCTHQFEAGCAVLEALEKGLIDRAAYENYLKMEREKNHYEQTVSEKRQKDKKFGKMVKQYKKDKNQFGKYD